MSVRLVSVLALYLGLVKAQSVPTSQFVSVTITNLITFNGRDYAVADNTAANEDARGGCDPRLYELKDGWEVAADNEDTKAVLISFRFPFQYICKVTASGQGYAIGFDEPNCKEDMLLTREEGGKKLFGVQTEKCGVLILSRTSQLENTWTQEQTITNVFTVEKHEYAALDNTPHDTLFLDSQCENRAACCQNIAMKVPTGWMLANSTMPGFTEAAKQPWRTFCSAGIDFDGTNCPYSLFNTNEYAAVRFCHQRVLIKRTPIDCVSSWTEWSACSTGCPSVRTRDRVSTTQEAQFGGVCKMTETNLSDCPQTCTPASTSVTSSDAASATTTNDASSTIMPSLIAVFAAIACAILF